MELFSFRSIEIWGDLGTGTAEQCLGILFLNDTCGWDQIWIVVIKDDIRCMALNRNTLT